MKITKINSQTLLSHGHAINLDEGGFSAAIYKYVDGEDARFTEVGSYPNEIDGAAISELLAGKRVYVVGQTRVNFAEIASRSEQSDYAIWCLNDMQNGYSIPFNRVVETTESKRHREHNKRMDETSSIKLIVPAASLDSSKWLMHVACHPDYPLAINSPTEELGLYETIEAYMPTLQAQQSATVAPNGTVSVAVSIQNLDQSAEAEIYALSSGGYMPVTRILTDSHQATFRISALGLESGESFKVKFGFKHYSGLASTVINVS